MRQRVERVSYPPTLFYSVWVLGRHVRTCAFVKSDDGWRTGYFGHTSSVTGVVCFGPESYRRITEGDDPVDVFWQSTFTHPHSELPVARKRVVMPWLYVFLPSIIISLLFLNFCFVAFLLTCVFARVLS